MATTTQTDNVEGIRAMHADVEASTTTPHISENALAQIAARKRNNLENEKLKIHTLAANMATALDEFGKSVKEIEKRIKNKKVPVTSEGCTKSLRCILKALNESLYNEEELYDTLSKKGRWKHTHTRAHLTLYNKIADCAKTHLKYTTTDESQVVVDFRAICLGMKINNETIITEQDAVAIENVLNALNDIQTEQIKTTIEMLEIMSVSPADSESALESNGYDMYWIGIYGLLFTMGAVGVTIGLGQIMDPKIITQNASHGRWFMTKSKVGTPAYYVYDQFARKFIYTEGATPIGPVITCPETISNAMFGSLWGSMPMSYTCKAGQILMHMPWLYTASSYIQHAMSLTGDYLPQILSIPTPTHAMAAAIGVAGVAGITLYGSYKYINNKRKREPPDDIETGLEEVRAVSDAQTQQTPISQQNKRPRTSARPT